MNTDKSFLEKIYQELFAWCECEEFSGYDPFDALNSRIFQSTPLADSRLGRLFFLQAVKRSPLDLRRVLRVEKGVNAKGLALFALAELARFRESDKPEHEKNIKELLARLLALKIEVADDRAAFGYNFDWQSSVFYAPLGTPTIVPTAFAAQALVEAYEIFSDEKYLRVAQEICEFIRADLNRVEETTDEICFSYTPLDRTVIFNASLLAGETLASVGAITKNEEYLNLAAKSACFVARRQQADGAWAYGAKQSQRWVDNFHTAYVLLSLFRLQNLIPDLKTETENVIEKGLNFWLENLFLPDGTPKYYDRETFPVDIHSASASIVALCEMREIDERCQPQAEKVAQWTIENMRDPAGFFYYQRRKYTLIKTPFIRWSQAWTAYALARLLESK